MIVPLSHFWIAECAKEKAEIEIKFVPACSSHIVCAFHTINQDGMGRMLKLFPISSTQIANLNSFKGSCFAARWVQQHWKYLSGTWDDGYHLVHCKAPITLHIACPTCKSYCAISPVSSPPLLAVSTIASFLFNPFSYLYFRSWRLTSSKIVLFFPFPLLLPASYPSSSSSGRIVFPRHGACNPHPALAGIGHAAATDVHLQTSSLSSTISSVNQPSPFANPNNQTTNSNLTTIIPPNSSSQNRLITTLSRL